MSKLKFSTLKKRLGDRFWLESGTPVDNAHIEEKAVRSSTAN